MSRYDIHVGNGLISRLVNFFNEFFFALKILKLVHLQFRALRVAEKDDMKSAENFRFGMSTSRIQACHKMLTIVYVSWRIAVTAVS